MPLYAAGQRIRGSEINALPQVYRVTTEQSNNTTSLINCVGLSFAAEVNASYLVELFLFYSVKKAADMQIKWTAPAATNGWWTPGSVDAGGAGGSVGSANAQSVAVPANLHLVTGDDAVDVFAGPVGTVAVGATPGTVQLQFAQWVVDGANPCKIRAGSAMRVSRMA